MYVYKYAYIGQLNIIDIVELKNNIRLNED